MRHPPPLNDLTPLDVKRKGVGVLAFVILVLAFAPVPMTSITADYSFELQPDEGTNLTIEQGGLLFSTITVDNTGNSMNAIVVYGEDLPDGWTLTFRRAQAVDLDYQAEATVLLSSGETALIEMRMFSSAGSELGKSYNVTVAGASLNSTVKRSVVYNMTVSSSVFTYTVTAGFPTAVPDDWARCTVQIQNAGTADAVMRIVPADIRPQGIDMFILAGGSNSSGFLELTVPAEGSAYFSIDVYVNSIAEPGERIISVMVYHDETLHRQLDMSLTVL